MIATQPAAARIELIDQGRTLSSVSVNLAAGHNRIATPIQPSPTGLVARVTATGAGGQIAGHAISFLTRPTLSTREFRRLIRVAVTWWRRRRRRPHRLTLSAPLGADLRVQVGAER